MVGGMPFWKKTEAELPPPGVVEAHRLSEALARLEGSLHCSERTCDESSGVACQYVDRRNRACKSAWCPQHRIVMDGQVLCRRHAGIVSALPKDNAASAPLPDLENRAPSLVSWIARELDADIRALLLERVVSSSGAQLIADPVFLIFVGSDRVRTWERAWKLATHTGTTLRVALQVEEAVDTQIAVKIGSNVIARETPPWIVQRPQGSLLPPEQDTKLRQEFNAQLLSVIGQGLDHELKLSTEAEAEIGNVKRIYRG
jgi:hypothetical protein